MFRRLALAFAVLILVPACAMKAHVEVSPGSDFSGYQTYRWVTEDLVLIQDGKGDERIRTAENEQRIRAAVEREFDAKGLTKSDGDDASIILAFTVGTRVRYTLEGGAAYNVVTHEPPATKTRASLRLYVFDGATKKQVWEGWTSKSLNGQEDPDTVVNTAVALILKEFPR